MCLGIDLVRGRSIWMSGREGTGGSVEERNGWMGSMPMYKRRCEESGTGEPMIYGLVGIAMVFLFVECAPHL